MRRGLGLLDVDPLALATRHSSYDWTSRRRTLSEPTQSRSADRPRVLLRARVNLHAMVFVMSGVAVLYAVYRIANLVPVVPYQPTYHAAEFVIDRVDETNRTAAAPRWAEGHVEPGGASIREPLIREPVIRTLGGTLVLMNDRAVPAVAGQRMRIWFSAEDDAPVVAMAQMRCIPDNRLLGFWMVFAAGAFGVGVRLTMRAGEYLQRTYHAERIG
jgi:hypothetical protein